MKEFFGKAVLSMAAQGGLLHGGVQQTEKNFFQRRAGRGDGWEETLSLQGVQDSAAHLCRTECTLYHTATLDIFKLCTDKGCTFSRLYMLELDNLEDISFHFDRKSISKITC